MQTRVFSRIFTQSHYRQNKSCYCPPSTSSLRTSPQSSRTQSPAGVPSRAENQCNSTNILLILLSLMDWCHEYRGGLPWAPVALANQHSWSTKVKQALGQDYGSITVQSDHNSQGIWLLVSIAGGTVNENSRRLQVSNTHQIQMKEH